MLTKTPLLSVVLPAYKHSGYLQKILQDISKQTFQDFELLVADDQSDDGSAAILECARKMFSPGQYYYRINPKRLGPVENLNQLIMMAKGKWIAVCNSDDEWNPAKLTCQIEYLENHPDYVGCFTLGHLIFENSQSKDISPDVFNQKDISRHDFFRKFWEKGNFLFHPSLVVKKEVYEKVGYYNAAFCQLPDYEFYIRLIKYGAFGIVEKDLVGYRRSNTNSSAASVLNCKRELTELVYIYEHFFDNVPPKLFYDSFQDLLPETIEKNAAAIPAHAVNLMKMGCAFNPESAKEAGERYCFRYFQDKTFSENMEKYGFTIFDFYRTVGQSGWGVQYTRIFPLSFQQLVLQIKMTVRSVPGSKMLKRFLMDLISFFRK